MANPYAALKPVESSMFSRAGYDESTWQLLLEFKSTSEIKAYLNVSPEVADEFMNAKSMGAWWNQNMRGNPAWEYEVLGADPNAPPPAKEEKRAAPKKQPQPELGITAEDIQAVDPSYQPDGLYKFEAESESHIALTYGGIDRNQYQMAVDIGVGHDETVATIYTPEMSVKDDIAMESARRETDLILDARPQAELLGKWTAPESAAEALDLLSEHETEINALIESCKQAGQAALAVKVSDVDSRKQAGETLTELVEQKDRATEMLEPFRAQLYEAYTYAADRKKAALEPLDSAIKQIKNRAVAWDQEQERIRQAAIRKAREEAEAEARRRQEEERQRITLAEVQDRLDEGDTAAAETLFDKPIDVPLPYVQPVYTPSAAPIIEGQSTSTRWKVDETALETEDGYIESVMALLRAVKDDKIDMRTAATYLRWDLVSLNKLAGALRGAFKVPGLAAAPVGNISVRRKAR